VTEKELAMAEEAQPLTSHLEELRSRIIKALVAVMIGFSGAFAVSERLFKLVRLPMDARLQFLPLWPFLLFTPAGRRIDLVFLGPAEGFWMYIKISFIAGLLVSLPVSLWQLWRFIEPGLLPRERRYALPFVLAGTVLFYTGAAFCFLLVLPFALDFLLNYSQALTPMISIERYVDFCLKFILAFGIIFELPVVLVFLTRMGIVTPAVLAKQRKYAILLAFVFAAFLTPTPDAFNQTLMAVPILVLYEAGILVSRMFQRREDHGDHGKGEEP
jgi:sec-independent protein translocase protein TatC